MLARKRCQGPGLVFAACLFMAAAAWAAAAGQDRIVLKDGSTIMGTVTGSRGGEISIDTDFAGALAISLEKVASVNTSEPMLIQLADERVVAEQPLRIEDEQLLVTSGQNPAQSYALSELLVVNPEPWELGIGYRWTGLVSLAMSMERGNTDTDELDYRLESIWRSKRDRYTLRFNGENDKANGETNTQKWYAQGKYDYFFDGPYYGGIQASAEHDKFTDLDLRYLVGPFVGRQFFDAPIFSLSADVGVSYVNEDFISANDQDYAAATWTVNASSNYLGGNSRLYLNNRGIWNLDQTSDLVVDTTFGLAFPLLWSLEAAAEVLLEYDSGAVDDVDELDQTYRFRVGYTW